MTPRVFRTICLALLSLSSVSGCKQLNAHRRPKYAPGTASKVLKVDMDSLRPAIAARIERAAKPAWVSSERWKKVHEIYARFGNAPLWLEVEGV